MAAFKEIHTIDEFIMFGFECNGVSCVMYFPSTTYEPLFLGPVSFINH